MLFYFTYLFFKEVVFKRNVLWHEEEGELGGWILVDNWQSPAHHLKPRARNAVFEVKICFLSFILKHVTAYWTGPLQAPTYTLNSVSPKWNL